MRHVQVSNFQIPTSDEFATAQSVDPEHKQLLLWIDTKITLSTDELAPLSGHLKCLAQIREEASLHDGVIALRRADNSERELVLVPSALAKRVIRFFYKGPGGAHQTAKATSANVIQRFYWPGLKCDVRLYVTCCPTCERILHLGRNPRAGLHHMAKGTVSLCS